MNSGSSSSSPQNRKTNSKRCTHGTSANNLRDAETTLDKRLKSFKASILDEVRHLINHNHQNTVGVDASVKPLSPSSPPTSIIPSLRTRSGYAGVFADSFSTRSAANTRCSTHYGKQ